MRDPRNLLLLFAIIAGTSYFFVRDGLGPTVHLIWKGAGVGLLALWALSRARNGAGRLVALVLAFGALGDVLIEAAGMTTGALAFLAGHIAAVVLYLRNRRATLELTIPVALTIAVAAWLMPADRGAAIGVGVYALGLGAMTGTALNSRYPRELVGLGALLFAASDLLLFAHMGPLSGSSLSAMFVWPLYFAGQLLIALGVVRTETQEAG
jgi:uncharacterized membrane protein YhhN